MLCFRTGIELAIGYHFMQYHSCIKPYGPPSSFPSSGLSRKVGISTNMTQVLVPYSLLRKWLKQVFRKPVGYINRLVANTFLSSSPLQSVSG